MAVFDEVDSSFSSWLQYMTAFAVIAAYLVLSRFGDHQKDMSQVDDGCQEVHIKLCVFACAGMSLYWAC